MSKTKKKILVTTYFSYFEGNSPAQWANDKIQALIKLGYEVTLITSILSKSISSKNLNIIKIPSFSPKDFLFEIIENKRLNNPTSIYSYLLFLFFSPIALIRLLQLLFLKKIGEGRWSWFLSNLILIPILLNKKFELFFLQEDLLLHIFLLF